MFFKKQKKVKKDQYPETRNLINIIRDVKKNKIKKKFVKKIEARKSRYSKLTRNQKRNLRKRLSIHG